MKITTKHKAVAALLAAVGLGAAIASPAGASTGAIAPYHLTGYSLSAPGATGISDAVFVQTNDQTGNQILAYSRASNGTLAFVHAYDTGGDGIAFGGAVVDKLASQEGLTYDASADLLIAVNAGSGTVTSFSVSGDRLSDPHVVAAGSEPVSVATFGKYAYVLDVGGTGAVTGLRIGDGRVSGFPGSTRDLGLEANQTPQFLNTPGQVGFSPNGSFLVVTTKANGSDIDVFPVSKSGQLSASPTVNASATGVPFGFVFDSSSRLLVAEAASSNLVSYAIDPDGTLTLASAVPDGQAALCWVTEVGSTFYVANAGSATLSGYTENGFGQLTLSSSVGNVATDAGPIDLAGSTGGAYLYAEAGGAGAVDEYSVGTGGGLTRIGSVDGLSGTGIEGIVAA